MKPFIIVLVIICSGMISKGKLAEVSRGTRCQPPRILVLDCPAGLAGARKPSDWRTQFPTAAPFGADGVTMPMPPSDVKVRKRFERAICMNSPGSRDKSVLRPVLTQLELVPITTTMEVVDDFHPAPPGPLE